MAIDDTSNNTAAEPEEPACDPNPSTGQSTIPPSDPEQIKNVKLLGYETLFVNDPGLQQLAWDIGIPPLSARHGEYEYEPVDDISLETTDLLRFNLGKFFYRFSNDAAENFEFVDPNVYNLELDTNPLPRPGPPYVSPIKYDFSDLPSKVSKLVNNSTIYGENNSQFILSLPKDPRKDTYMFPFGESSNQILSFLKIIVGQNIFDLNIPTRPDPNPQPGLLGGSEPRWTAHNPINHEDHSFVFLHPYGENTADEISNIKVLYADAKSDYNFFQSGYQDIFSLPQNFTAPLPFELYLPNFNIMLAEKNNPINASQIDSVENVSIDKTYAIHTTLNNRLPGNILRSMNKTNAAYEEALHGTSGNEYCESWGRTFKQHYMNIVSDQVLSSHVQKFKNVIYPPNFLKSGDIDILKENFPFYNEIKFNTDTNTKVADLLSKSKLFDFLIALYINSVEDPDTDHYYTYQKALAEDTAADTSSAEITFTPPDRGSRQLPVFDFEIFLTTVLELFASSGISETIFQLALTNIKENTISVDSEDFFDDQMNLMQLNPLVAIATKLKFLTLYSNFVKENLRTYKEIISGATCYNETLFYRIEKKDAEGNIIQNFYVLNEAQIDDVALIDSQIVYGKKYSYKIYAVQYVLGNSYKYGKLNPEEPGTIIDKDTYYASNISVDSQQSAKLIEIPYIKPLVTTAYSAPSLPPNVDFYSFKNEDKKVLIMLQPSVGERRSTPIAIKPEDMKAIANSNVDSEGKILFKTEGDVQAYEMFRISEDEFVNGPRSFSSFGQPGLSKKVVIDAKLGSPSIVDDIQPNKKYWYIFRSLDKKSMLRNSESSVMNFSNPTNIFEVKLVNNDGAIYLTVSTYDIDYFHLLNKRLTTGQEINRPFRKYLRIKPAFGQSFINEDPADGGLDTESPEIKDSIKDYIENSLGDDVRTIKLGSKEQSVFGFHEDNANVDFNQFKVRIISKKTGKKFDIYTRFRKPILQK